MLEKHQQRSGSFYMTFKHNAGGQAARGVDGGRLCDSRKATVQAKPVQGRPSTYQGSACWSTCLGANTICSRTTRRWLWVLERVCCLGFDKSMVKSLLSRLLNPRSGTRGQIIFVGFGGGICPVYPFLHDLLQFLDVLLAHMLQMQAIRAYQPHNAFNCVMTPG